MKLYFSKGACSLAPHIILEELGLPYETQQLNYDKGDGEKPEFLKLNPMGTVPVLVLDNGEALTEAAVILQYLADLRPELNLAPKAGTFERVRLQQTLNFIATEVHKGFSPLFAIERISQDPKTQEEMRKFWSDALAIRLGILNTRLSHQDWLMPQGFTVADAYLFVVLNWSRSLKVELSQWPALPAYQERVKARAAVQRALKAEHLLR